MSTTERAHRICSSFLLLLILSPGVHAAERSFPLNVRVEMMENTVEGQQVRRLGAEAEVNEKRPTEWCFFYGEVAAQSDGHWEGIRSGSGYRAGPCRSSSFASLRGTPYLVIDVSGRIAKPIRGMEASISVHKLSGFTNEGRPTYQESRETRTLKSVDDLVVPVLLADAKEKQAFGANEVFLRWRARNLIRSAGAGYGEIRVSSDTPRANVLLDGGTAARTSAGSPTVLKNVPTGVHEVSIRDFSGREVRQKVRVEKGRATNITVNLLPADRSTIRGDLLPLGRNSQGQEEYWRKKDGALVVRISGGPFRMGSPEGVGEPPEHPQHEVYVGEFLMDKTEVTWGQFRTFSEATGAPAPKTPLWGTPDDYPVTGVKWDEARAYCEWLGGRLPTEAEWEKAARGTDSRRYPWGDDWDENRCNTIEGGPHRPMAVATFPDCLSPYGILDMAGSVWELCEDWFDERYYENSPSKDPGGPAAGRTRVTRGGDWLHQPSWARVSYRTGSLPTSENVRQGFRCVQSAPDHASSESVTAHREALKGDRSPATQQLSVELETVSNPIHDREAERCVASSQMESKHSMSWWSTFGDARPENEKQKMPGATVRCGTGAFDKAGKIQGDVPASPLLILELSSVSLRKPGPVTLTETSLAVSTRRFTGLSGDGKPVYASSNQTRSFRLEESGEAVLVVFVPTAREKETLGVHEVLLRVRVKPVLQPPAPAYGIVSIASDAPEATVFLDGGEVGHTNAQGNLVLRNILPGERELRLRDNSGREARRVLDALRDQTVPIFLSLAKPLKVSPDVLISLGNNPVGARQFRREKDGAVMVYVPEGEFLMGNLETERQPLPHTVVLSSFLIDKTAVTFAQFEQFCRENAKPLPPEPYWGVHADHPAVFVTWEEARAYCEWAGARLPTEAEREKAARGTDQRKYPWGDEEPTPERAVFRRTWGYISTEPVGTHPAGASPYGILDAAGNVWEWCEDWYDEAYYRSSPSKDPRGPRSGRSHVVRGGSWDSRPSVLSCSCRNFGHLGYREGDYGFRCAAEPPKNR